MESTQSVHGRITYRRAASVIDAKIESIKRIQSTLPPAGETVLALQTSIEFLESVRGELEWRNATHYWPSPL